MNGREFEQFVQNSGADILRFCRMTAGSREAGDELYQDTMLKLLEKKHKLDLQENMKSYALSVAVFLWKNQRKKYARRSRIASMDSWEERQQAGEQVLEEHPQRSPEEILLNEMQIAQVQDLVTKLPEEYRILIYLYYSAELKIREIAEVLHLPEGTIKSRMRKAKQYLKQELEDMGYDK